MLEVIQDKPDVVVTDVVPRVPGEVTDVLTGDVNIDPERVIKATQTVRTGILRELTNHGTYLPTDKESLTLTMQLMRDMDTTAQNSIKLNIEEKNSVNAANVATLADMIISRTNMGSLPNGVRRDPTLGLELPVLVVTDEEIAQGEVPLSAEEWIEDRD